MVQAFLLKYYGTKKDGRPVNVPVDTITTKERHALVTVTIGGEITTVKLDNSVTSAGRSEAAVTAMKAALDAKLVSTLADVAVITVSGNTATLASAVTFPAGTGGSGTATHWGLGCSSSGAGKLLYKGAISPNIVCGNGVTPELSAGTLLTED